MNDDIKNVNGGGIAIREKTKLGYKIAYEGDGVYINRPHQKRGVVQRQMIQTLKTGTDVGVVVKDKNKKLKIRKLTPKEYFRLMGFSDSMFNNAKETLNDTFYKGRDKSSSQLYKMAGNSIITTCPYYILKELYNAMPYLFDDLKVVSLFSGIGAFEVGLDMLYKKVINNA